MRVQFLTENLKERDHLGYLCIYGRIILRWIIGCGEDVVWGKLARDTGQWRSLTNTIMNTEVP
jgi:hypothetical protein